VRNTKRDQTAAHRQDVRASFGPGSLTLRGRF
jgi:hypothetical protein